jgi:glutamyl-tRNA reductase
LVLSTCNRLEVYADVTKFHGGVQEVTDRISARTGVAIEELTEHLYVHYEDRAVQHLFSVAAGLDSMVVGEQQILGQLRGSLQVAREEGCIGRSLGQLVEHALRTGKRVHTETGIDGAGRSVVSVGVELAERSLGALGRVDALIVGAGAMISLAGTILKRAGVRTVTVINRTPDRAERLASALGGRTAPPEQLTDELSRADLLVSCTGAVGTVVSTGTVRAAMTDRADRPLFVLDLALPRDVEAGARAVPGVTVVDLEGLRSVLEDAELNRLRSRLPALDERASREVEATVARVVDKLLHAPTVRIKELAESVPGDSSADIVRDLFALDPGAADVVTRADVIVAEEDAP